MPELDNFRIAPEQFERLVLQRVRNNNIGQVLDTVGIELESIALPRDVVASILNTLPAGLGELYKVHRDGSSEINVYGVMLDNRRILYFSSHTKEAESLFSRRVNKSVAGYELISIPMDIETAELSLWTLLPKLKMYGDFVSNRCATHIHVGGMKNLGFLKNSLMLGLWFDDVFYSLAHLDGNRFRGFSNNAIYARPLINGPFVKYNGEYHQILNWEYALKSKSIYDFYLAYGANVSGELSKYHPGRYFSINLYSIPRIGTVEFRHFNQTFNPAIVSAVTRLCQIFVDVSIRAKFSDLCKLDIGNVFVLQQPSYYLHKLYRLLEMAESLGCSYSLDAKYIRELENVIYRYGGIGIENKEILTHCRDFNLAQDSLEILKTSENKPEPDGHTDIHNIQYSDILEESL